MNINRLIGLCAAMAVALVSCNSADKVLKEEILNDTRMDQVYALGLETLSSGLNAGSGYVEVWIRDFNTFIKPAMAVNDHSVIRDALDNFCKFQGEDGNIIDGYTPKELVDAGEGVDYDFIASEYAPEFLAHKNSVETDQESSFVQAVAAYVNQSEDVGYLSHEVAGMTVARHMRKALDYLWECKLDENYGLITGATTVDWGDVQPEHGWGVDIDENTHYAIDVYDNAMFILAINDYLSVVDDEEWIARRDEVAANVRKYLWDEQRCKFIPHVYLNGSPFPEDFDENAIWYTGGTGIAALAGLMSDEELSSNNRQFLSNMQEAGAQSICMTAYPPYPEGYFSNSGMQPYMYQNGGDWTWYGVRVLWAMIERGMVKDAYEEFSPMLDRVIANQGFNEWYSPDGTPRGSGTFRGEAGVMIETIDRLRAWAGR